MFFHIFIKPQHMSTQVCKVQTAQPFFFLFIVKVFVFERSKLKFAVIIHIWYAATNCHIRAPLSLLPFSVITATRMFIDVLLLLGSLPVLSLLPSTKPMAEHGMRVLCFGMQYNYWWYCKLAIAFWCDIWIHCSSTWPCVWCDTL